MGTKKLDFSNEIATIDFYGDKIIAFEENDKIYISVQQACVTIGLVSWSQYRKIDKDPIYQQGLKTRQMTSLFGDRETRFLERKYFHEFLQRRLEQAQQTVDNMQEERQKAQERSDTIIMQLTRQLEQQTLALEDMRKRSIWQRIKAVFVTESV